jgi:hypothetical protein
VKHFARAHGARPLIICPAALIEMWERYDEVYELNAKVVSMGLLVKCQPASKTDPPSAANIDPPRMVV